MRESAEKSLREDAIQYADLSHEIELVILLRASTVHDLPLTKEKP